MRSISIENVLNAADSLGWSESAQVLGRPEWQVFAVVTTAKYRNMPLVYSLLLKKKDR